MTPSAAARAGRTSTRNVQGFGDYSQGRALLDRVDIPGNVDAAIDAYGRAIAKDPQFALAHAGLRDADWAKYRETRDEQWTEPALRSILDALRIDPTQPEVRISLALVQPAPGVEQSDLRQQYVAGVRCDEHGRSRADWRSVSMKIMTAIRVLVVALVRIAKRLAAPGAGPKLMSG